MEVVSGNDGLLTNIEVLDVIRENRESRGLGSQQHSNVKISLQNRELIETKTMKYVSGSRIGSFSSELIGQCLSAIKKLELGLTDGELVQIANLAPESEVELYLIIEDCAERLTEEQVASIQNAVTETYAPHR